MEPNDSHPPSPAPASGGKGWGILLIVVGLLFGGAWTVAIFVGEWLTQGVGGPGPDHMYYFGTALTGAASLALVVAGVMLVSGAGKYASTALWLTLAAAAAYVFGFAVCLVGW